LFFFLLFNLKAISLVFVKVPLCTMDMPASIRFAKQGISSHNFMYI
jgi:hypothetical protein